MSTTNSPRERLLLLNFEKNMTKLKNKRWWCPLYRQCPGFCTREHWTRINLCSNPTLWNVANKCTTAKHWKIMLTPFTVSMEWFYITFCSQDRWSWFKASHWSLNSSQRTGVLGKILSWPILMASVPAKNMSHVAVVILSWREVGGRGGNQSKDRIQTPFSLSPYT